MRRSAEARESLLRPSELHRRSRAAVLAASCGKLFSIWRQDGVVDASSGVVQASLEASQDQKQSENKAGFAVLVSYSPLALAQLESFTFYGAYLREELK